MADDSEAMAMMGVVGDAAAASAATLFDYAIASSYNTAAGAATAPTSTASTAPTPTSTIVAGPLVMNIPLPSAPAATATTTSTGMTTAALFNHELDGELALPDKKTGRPSHPAWEHFVRGSKRNRFHHHAYCKYCSAHGAEPVPVRGVSGNMIRHLQKCVYCPEEIVLQLRVLCAQKDAVNYNKRHHHQSQPPLHVDVVDGMIQASAAAAAAVAAAAAAVAATATTSAVAPASTPASTSATMVQTIADGTAPSAAKKLKRAPAADASAGGYSADAFTPMQLAVGPHNAATAAAAGASAGGVPFVGKTLASSTAVKTKNRQSAASTRGPSTSGSPQVQPVPHPAAINQAALNRLVLRATLSGSMPLDWMSMEEAGRLSIQSSRGVVLPSRLAVYRSEVVSSLASSAYETHIARLKDEATFGCTLTINYWFNKAERTNLMLFSLVNAHGEATAWKLVDVGPEDVSLEELSTQIKTSVITLGKEGVHLIAIVTDNLLAYAAAKAAVTSGDDSSSPIAVLPSFEAFLVNAMGVILTISESHLETMGNVIELVAAFSNTRLRDTLRRECGDPDALLVLPSKDKWFSFIDCIDSVRQFEDMIKIIGLRVVIHQSEAAVVQRGEENSVSEAASSNKTPSVLSGSVPDVPAHVLETIQNPQFWETVVSLSELMSPIKETYKVMLSHNASQQPSNTTTPGLSPNRNNSSTIMTFSLSDVFYQLGRMYQQYTSIIADWEENPSATRVVSHARYLQEQVNKTWKLYDQPLMYLAYTLNYNMSTPLVARNLPALQWLAIGKYAKEYFRRWFCNGVGAQNARTGARGSSLNEEASTQFLEDVLAFKERKYPFDAESVCDFDNPRAFYQLISDSNPLMHLFGTRLFSFATSVPQLARVVPGKSSITRVATSACSQELLFPLLQMNLRARSSTRTQASKNFLAVFQQNSRNSRRQSNSDSTLESDRDLHSNGSSQLLSSSNSNTGCGIWNDREWRLLAKQWKLEWEHEGNVGNVLDSVASLSTSGGTRLLAELLSLDQIFKDKLPSRLQQSREEEAVVDV